MISGILIIAIFLVFAFLIFKNKIPTFLALIAMSILIAMVARVPFSGEEGILVSIIERGSINMASSIMALIFGAWLGEIMTETGVTKDIIKRATKFGGTRPVLLAIVLSAAVILLFTAVTGLGVTIMIGTLVLPILIAVGIRPITAGVIFIFARGIGLMLNVAQWQLFMNAASIDIETIKPLAFTIMGSGIVGILIFIFIEVALKKNSSQELETATLEKFKGTTNEESVNVSLLAMLMPFIPFPLILFLDWPIVPALLLACVYGCLVTSGTKTIQVLTKTAPQAVRTAAPSIMIMIAIGMIITAVKNPLVSETMSGLMVNIMPTNLISYILFFALLAPLCLYRGPFNMWGLGSGVLGIMLTSNALPASAIVAAFLACLLFLQVSDPTNSHHVWAAEYLKIEVFEITKKSFFYLWAVVAVAIVIYGITLIA